MLTGGKGNFSISFLICSLLYSNDGSLKFIYLFVYNNYAIFTKAFKIYGGQCLVLMA